MRERGNASGGRGRVVGPRVEGGEVVGGGRVVSGEGVRARREVEGRGGEERRELVRGRAVEREGPEGLQSGHGRRVEVSDAAGVGVTRREERERGKRA